MATISIDSLSENLAAAAVEWVIGEVIQWTYYVGLILDDGTQVSGYVTRHRLHDSMIAVWPDEASIESDTAVPHEIAVNQIETVFIP